MKKKSGSRTKRLFARLFNVRGWIDFDRLRLAKQYIINQGKRYFVPQETTQIDSFEAAKARLKLSDRDIQARQKGLFRLTMLMVALAYVILGYAVYNLVNGRYLATFLSVIVLLLTLALAFRYHFWYFQIKHRRLGCSLREWFSQGLMGGKDE